MKKEVLDKIKILKNKYEPDGFIVLGIFGSYARGEENEKSDIDILIEYQGKDKSLFDLVDLKYDLEKTLSRKVDLVTYSSIYWRIRDRVLAEQVVIL